MCQNVGNWLAYITSSHTIFKEESPKIITTNVLLSFDIIVVIKNSPKVKRKIFKKKNHLELIYV